MQALGYEEQLAAIQKARDEAQPESLYRLEHMGLWTKLRPYVRVTLHCFIFQKCLDQPGYSSAAATYATDEYRKEGELMQCTL